MPDLHVLRVFCDPAGAGGNPLGVVLDGLAVAAERRQGDAAAIGFSEIVYVDDRESAAVRIFTPTLELPFAGHPLVGTSWLLDREGDSPSELNPPSGPVPARVDSGEAYVIGRPEWAPPFEWTELSSPAEVEGLDGPPGGHDLIGVYAWIDDSTVRARVFPLRLGIAEDEATGAAAVRLGAQLRRRFTIHQGHGSQIRVRPIDDAVEIGGRVQLDEVRPYPCPGVDA